MRADQIELGHDYEVRRGYWRERHRVRILSKDGGGLWKGRVMRDKYSEGNPGQECLIESRNILRPWGKTRKQLELKEALDREWRRAERKADRKARELVDRLSRFNPEMEYIHVADDGVGLPGEAVANISFSLEDLKALADALEGIEAQTPADTHSELLELISR